MTSRLEKEEVWDYPLEAVREAIVNVRFAIGTYTVMSHIEVQINPSVQAILIPQKPH